MKRLGRILFNAITALSLILFVATVALWVRSHYHADDLSYLAVWSPAGRMDVYHFGPMGGATTVRWHLISDAGRLGWWRSESRGGIWLGIDGALGLRWDCDRTIVTARGEGPIVDHDALIREDGGHTWRASRRGFLFILLKKSLPHAHQPDALRQATYLTGTAAPRKPQRDDAVYHLRYRQHYQDHEPP